jgi:UDP-N-acetylmuramoyl-tripeptide--D-alanyl-D-alanine ligase
MISIKKLYSIFQKHPKISIDSRKIEAGCLFFALSGTHVNGNQFAQNAIDAGAAFAVVDDSNLPKNRRFLQVKNVTDTLQKLARHHRQQFHFPIIAITGSNGKTTTKELVAAVLGSHYRTHFTQGNFNNELGVPLTLLAMPNDTEVAVIEMGANHLREINFLCEIAEPTHGLITNIGHAHLEGFGSFLGVKRGKSELFKYLIKKNGLIFLNNDEKFLPTLAKKARKIVAFEQSKNRPDPAKPPIETQLLSEKPFLKIGFIDPANGQIVETKTQLIGRYNIGNLMTAVALGRYFKVPATKIKGALEAYLPQNMRSQIIERDGNTFVLDAYNANPTSMTHALESFSRLKATRKIVVLGEMRELGAASITQHQLIFNLAKKLKMDEIWLVGVLFSEISDDSARFFENSEALKSYFDTQMFSKTHFLVKGSRGIHLETMLGLKH